MSRQVVLDTETTGLSAADGDRLVEIGCVELLNRRPSGRTLHLYLNPGRASHPDALKVHGLSEDFLADKPRFEAVVDELLGFLDGAELIIHNASFDLGFLDAELARLGRPPLRQHVVGVIDSLRLARETWPGKAASLDALCKRLEVDHSRRTLHGALLDAELLAEVFLRMTRGQDALVIDKPEATRPGGEGLGMVDEAALAGLRLRAVEPSPDEAEAHAAFCAELAKSCPEGARWSHVLA